MKSSSESPNEELALLKLVFLLSASYLERIHHRKVDNMFRTAFARHEPSGRDVWEPDENLQNVL